MNRPWRIATLGLVVCCGGRVELLAESTTDGDAGPATVTGDAHPKLDAAPPPSSSKPTPTPASFVGRWKGVGVQKDGHRWDMDVTITTTAAGRCATVDYPTLGCGADWLCLPDATATTLVAEERLTRGFGRCLDHGIMTMKLVGPDTIDWSWANGTRPADANATLKRIR